MENFMKIWKIINQDLFKKQKYIVAQFIRIAGVYCFLCLTACSESKGIEDFAEPSNIAENDETDQLNITPATIWAQSGVEVFDGVIAEGTFEKSRSKIQLSCKAKDKENILSINGKEILSVPQEKTILIYDINTDDAFLELIIGEKHLVEIENGFEDNKDAVIETEELWKVNAYQVYPDGLREILLLPQAEDSSFYIRDWYELSFRKGCVELYRSAADGKLIADLCELMPEEGYFVSYNERQTVIMADGETLKLPEAQVSICSRNGLGVAFSVVSAMAGTVHYNIYRTADGGETWLLAAEDIVLTSGELEHIDFIGEETIICCFDIRGISQQHWSYLISEDGGISWKNAMEIEWMKKYPSVWERE